MAMAAEATEDNCHVLNTILAMAVSFVLPTVLPQTVALPGPWQLPTAQQEAPTWA